MHNRDIPYLSKDWGIKNSSYSVNEIGKGIGIFCVPIPFHSSVIEYEFIR